MHIRWHLQRLLDERGRTAYWLAKQLHVTRSAAYKLANHEGMPRLTEATLAKLCDALDCQPGDLLEYRKR